MDARCCITHKADAIPFDSPMLHDPLDRNIATNILNLMFLLWIPDLTDLGNPHRANDSIPNGSRPCSTTADTDDTPTMPHASMNHSYL